MDGRRPGTDAIPGITVDRPATVGASVGAWERLTRALFQERDTDRVCDAVCRELVDGFGFSRALLATIDRERDRLVTRAGYDPSVPSPVARALVKLFTIPLSPQPDGRLLVAAWCALKGEQVHVEDAANYSFRLQETTQRPTLPKVFGAKEYALTPVRGLEGPLGLIAVDNKGREGPDASLRPDELRLLEVVGTLVGIALSVRTRTDRETAPARPPAAETPRRGQVWEIQAILDGLREGLIVLAPGGTLRYLNRSASSMLDTVPWEAIGKPWREVLPLDEAAAEKLDAVLGGLPGPAGAGPLRWSLGGEEGPPRFVDVEFLPLGPRGRSEDVVLLLDDVTEETETERSREEFIHMLVHDLNTPLQSVVGFAELLLMERAGELNETQRDFLARIESSGWEMTELVKNVLEVLELETGRAEILRERVDPFPFVLQVIDELRERHRDADPAEVAHDVPPALPPLNADRRRLGKAFRSLLERAMDASGPAGVVRVRAEVGEEDSLRFHLEDSGPPLDPEAAGRLFRTALAVRGGRDPRERRRSLELALAGQIVRAHGGRIRASAHPEGTRITLELPCIPEGGAPGAGASS